MTAGEGTTRKLLVLPTTRLPTSRFPHPEGAAVTAVAAIDVDVIPIAAMSPSPPCPPAPPGSDAVTTMLAVSGTR